VAGPYQSQSSVPKIRKAATRREHRKVSAPAPESSPPTQPGKATRVKVAPKAPDLTKVLKLLKAPRPDPSTALSMAKLHGTLPATSIKREYGAKPYRKAEKAATDYLAKHEGLKEDPIAELAISTAATAGLGGLASLAAKGGAEGVGAVGAQIASKEATVGSTLAEKALKVAAAGGKRIKAKPGNVVRDVKSAPARTARRIKETPERVRTAPARAKRAATTSEGRKAAARSAAHHPVRTGYAGVAVLPPGVLPGDASERARAAAEGTVSAIVHHPGETLKTTLRSLPGAITAPAALLGAAGESALHGTTKPLEKTASDQAKGLEQILANTFSGDPKKAEKAARKEGSLALVTPLPAISRLHSYERGRSALREGAGVLRGKLAMKGEAANRSIRHAPVEENVFAFTARHEARKKTALIKQRADNPHRVAAAHHENAITSAIAKAPKGSHVALQTLAEYGIRDAKHAAIVRGKGPGDAQLVKALDYVDQHPEVFTSKGFKKALQAVAEASRTAPAALVGKGERARLLQQGDVFGHTRPEHMAPEGARKLTGESTREGAWQHLQTSEGRLRELRRQGRQKLDQVKVLSGPEKARLTAEGKAAYAEARKLQQHNKAVYKTLDPYTRPGQSIDASKRQPYDSKMLDAYKKQVEASREAAGMAPAIWTHHAPATGDKGAGIENRFPTNAGRVEHMREGNLAKADNLDRSLEGLLRGTVHLPRLRAGGKQFGRDFVQEFKTPFKIDGKQKVVGQGSEDWAAITRPKSKENPNGGQFDPKTWARFPLREWKNAVKDPFTEDGRLVELLTEAEQGRIKGSEPWVLMPREAIKEARAQISPEHNIITEGANKLSRVASRTILGTNPAWAIAQIPAEGIPLLMAKPSLLNPGKLASLERDIQRYKKQDPEGAIAMQATAGASPLNAAANRTPLDQQETYTPALWEKGAKSLTRGKTARSAISFAKLRALGVFDAKRQNEYRTLLYAAEADKRFRSWHAGLTDLFDRQAKLSRDFRGKSRAELWDWLNNDPKGKLEQKRLVDYVDNIQGNWSAFSRFERALAPLTIFYPFLRYSLRWTLWTFPKTHPVTATIAYMLGQANANQLEKLVGGPLQNPIAYAYPAFSNAKGETDVLPGGSRISPGQSNFTQAIATGNPAQILSSANPFIGAGITGLTGVEPFTGEKSSLPQGEAAINALLSMPAPARLAGVKLGGQSVASKAFAQYDPNRSERSSLFPFLSQSGKDFKGSEQLSKDFSAKYGKGHVPSALDSPRTQEVLFGPNGKVDKKKLGEFIEEIHASEAASKRVKAKENPFYPAGPGWTEEQTKALKEIEEAWKTGEKKVKGQYGSGGGQYSKGTGQYSSGSGQYSSSAGQYGG
jgi:hypothetical protein